MLSDRTLEQLRATGARVRIGFPFWLRLLLLRDVVAITLGRRIYMAPSLARRGRHFEAILRHELAHVRQVGELGLLRFVWQYLREYARLRRGGLSPAEAYAANRFESDARKAEEIEEV